MATGISPEGGLSARRIHGHGQEAIPVGRKMTRTVVLTSLACAVPGLTATAQDAEPNHPPGHLEEDLLPGTKPLTWSVPLDARMRAGAHQFIERKIDESLRDRGRYWNRDLSSPTAYEGSIEANRQRFKRIIGVVDDRAPVSMERFGDDANPALVAEAEKYRVFQVRWPVLKNIYTLPVVYGEGLLLEPKVAPAAAVVALPDADQTPEQIVGLAGGVAPESQFARRLAESGFEVLVPVLLNRSVFAHEQPQREWIYRQAFHMGRHVIGYEVQKVLAAVDWFEQQRGPDVRVGVAGYAEGGLVAFYAAAVDSRIDAALGQRVLFRFPAETGLGAALPHRLGAPEGIRRCGDRRLDRPARAGRGAQLRA